MTSLKTCIQSAKKQLICNLWFFKCKPNVLGIQMAIKASDNKFKTGTAFFGYRYMYITIALGL